MKPIMQILVLLSIATFSLGEIRGYNNNNYYSNRNSYDNQNNRYTGNLQEWSGYSHSIREGECKGTKLVDETVSKDADPYTTKKSTYTWMGRDMFHITCIRVINEMVEDDKAGTARITSGGVGEGKVSIEMISKNSQRLQFQVEIWGESTRQQADNMAILTNTPDKILYMGGKKYCECR